MPSQPIEPYGSQGILAEQDYGLAWLLPLEVQKLPQDLHDPQAA